MFLMLGFIIHLHKSVFIPTQKLVFLGFILDSVQMRIYLTTEKMDKVRSACIKLLTVLPITIRDVAQALGYTISCFPGVMFGPLYFRQLEMEKLKP